nr:unnamed protein product [Spirometra erinaceieuropaei]
MNFQSRLSTNTVHDLFFAAAFNNFNFIVNTEKTVVKHQPPANVTDYAPHINSDTILMDDDIVLQPVPLLPLLMAWILWFCILFFNALFVAYLIKQNSLYRITQMLVMNRRRTGETRLNRKTPRRPPLPPLMMSAAPSSVTITISILTPSDLDSVKICSHYGHAFTSHTGLLGHPLIHRTETGAPVPGAPTYTKLICSHCPHGLAIQPPPRPTSSYAVDTCVDNSRLRHTITPLPTDTCNTHQNHESSHNKNTQLAPLMQVGNVLLGTFSICLLCCIRDSRLRE